MTAVPLHLSRYRTTPERAGGALALGTGVCGAATAALGWHGSWGLAGTLIAALSGALLGGGIIVLLAGPLWWWVQRRGLSGPVSAGAIGAAIGGGLTLLVLGFGADGDGVAFGAIWASAGAMALIAAFLGALLALAMWLVGYRTIR